nr:MATE family efflux transporter [bacterium]
MQTAQDQRLGTERIPTLMVRLAVPSIVAQLINMLYNIVDRMYIGHIPEAGPMALTGLGLTFPIIMIISAFSAFVGAGGAPLAAIQLGRGDKQKAEHILGNGTIMLLFFSVVLTAVFLWFRRPLLYFFGASDSTIGYANDYLTIYLVGTVFVQLALGLNMFISSQGQARTAMLSVVIGAVANIALDPLFIFVFKMGVRGAALATILSQALSAAWVVGFLASNRSIIRIRLWHIRPSLGIMGSIAALGISPFIMQATESAICIVFTNGLQRYGGDLYVGSMTILQSVMQLMSIPIQGFTQGVQPIISFNFGAGKFDRVKQTIKITTIITVSASTVMCLAVACFPRAFGAIFTPDEQLLGLVGKVLPIFVAGMWIFGIQMSCQSAFLGLGQAKISLCIAVLRKVILLIPLAILLPRFYGVMGIYYAEPISDTLSAVTAGITFLCSYKRILSQQSLGKLEGQANGQST